MRAGGRAVLSGRARVRVLMLFGISLELRIIMSMFRSASQLQTTFFDMPLAVSQNFYRSAGREFAAFVSYILMRMTNRVQMLVSSSRLTPWRGSRASIVVGDSPSPRYSLLLENATPFDVLH